MMPPYERLSGKTRQPSIRPSRAEGPPQPTLTRFLDRHNVLGQNTELRNMATVLDSLNGIPTYAKLSFFVVEAWSAGYESAAREFGISSETVYKASELIAQDPLKTRFFDIFRSEIGVEPLRPPENIHGLVERLRNNGYSNIQISDVLRIPLTTVSSVASDLIKQGKIDPIAPGIRLDQSIIDRNNTIQKVIIDLFARFGNPSNKQIQTAVNARLTEPVSMGIIKKNIVFLRASDKIPARRTIKSKEGRWSRSKESGERTWRKFLEYVDTHQLRHKGKPINVNDIAEYLEISVQHVRNLLTRLSDIRGAIPLTNGKSRAEGEQARSKFRDYIETHKKEHPGEPIRASELREALKPFGREWVRMRYQELAREQEVPPLIIGNPSNPQTIFFPPPQKKE